MPHIISTEQLYRLFSKVSPYLFTAKCQPYTLIPELRALRDYMAQGKRKVRPDKVAELMQALARAVIASPNINNLNAALDLIKQTEDWSFEHGLALPGPTDQIEARLLRAVKERGPDPASLFAAKRGTAAELAKIAAAAARRARREAAEGKATTSAKEIAAKAAVDHHDWHKQGKNFLKLLVQCEQDPGLPRKVGKALSKEPRLVFYVGEKGETALNEAACFGDAKLVKLVYDTIFKQLPSYDVMSRVQNAWPPILWALRVGNHETARFLLRLAEERHELERVFKVDLQDAIIHMQEIIANPKENAKTAAEVREYQACLDLAQGLLQSLSKESHATRLPAEPTAAATAPRRAELTRRAAEAARMGREEIMAIAAMRAAEEEEDDDALALAELPQRRHGAIAALPAMAAAWSAPEAAAPPPLPAHADDADVPSLLRQRERRRRAPAAAMATVSADADWPRVAPGLAQLGSSPSIARPWAVSAQRAMAAAWPQMDPNLAQLAFAATAHPWAVSAQPAMAAAWPQMAPGLAQLGSAATAPPWAVSAQPAMAAAWPQMAPGLAQLGSAAPTAPAASWDSVPLRPPSLDPAALGAAAAAMVAASATDPGQSLQTPKNIQKIQNTAYYYFGSSTKTTLRSIDTLFRAIKEIPGISKDQVINFLRKMTFPVEATAGETQEITFLELMHRAQPETEKYVGTWVSEIQKLFKDHGGSLSEQEVKFLTAKKPIGQPQLLEPKGVVYLPMTGLAQLGSAAASSSPKAPRRAVAASSEMPRATPPAVGEAETLLSAADITELRVMTSKFLRTEAKWHNVRAYFANFHCLALARSWSSSQVADVLRRLTLPIRTTTGVVEFVSFLEVVRNLMPQSAHKYKSHKKTWVERVRSLLEEHGWKLSKKEMAFLTRKPKGSPLPLLSPEEIKSLASSPLAVAAAAPPQPAMAAGGAAAPSGPPPPGGGGPSRSSSGLALPSRALRKRDRAPAESEPAAPQENPAKRAHASTDAAGHVATARRTSLVWQAGLASDSDSASESGSAYEDDSASSDTSSSP